MPMRLYRASTRYASAHIADNLWLWIAIFSVVTAALCAARYAYGGGDHLGDLSALSGCVLGVLVMTKSQVGFVSDYVEQDDDMNDTGVAPVTPAAELKATHPAA